MCGICGFVGLSDKNLLRQMTDSMLHRGPDDSGIFIDDGIGLGHRRLSIIDLSKKGHQPLTNENQDIFIVFNGEIYNFLELRTDLEKKGHVFNSHTDTEAIVHLYEEEGFNCVNHLDGMFAFAIYDMRKKLLFLARDRLGKKPLYYNYIEEKGIFIFASEMKALLEYNEFKRQINFQAMHDYLSFRYIPEPETLLKGILKLPAGHYLSLSKNKLEIKRYWDLNFSERPVTLNSAATELRHLLEQAVKKRLISDVPLGVYLSGGLDSSLIVGMMKKYVKEPKTFTIGYDIPDFEDELSKARQIAEHFGTDHHEVIAKIDPIKELPKIVWHMDEPVADPASIPVYYLSEQAKKKVTVILVGEGSDEQFAGYEQYKILTALQMLKPIMPSFLRKNVIAPVSERVPLGILNKFFKYSSSLGEAGRLRFSNLVKNYGSLYRDYFLIQSIFSEAEKSELYSDKFKENKFRQSDSVFKHVFNTNYNLLNKMLYADNKTFLLQLLLKADKMTMAHSVEARVPFLDKSLVEYAATLPANLKLRNFKDKFILRHVAKGIVPDYVVKRKKQRFFVPIHHWFEKDIKNHFFDTFSREKINERGFFDYSYIEKIRSHYSSSPLYYSRQMWNLLILEKWFNEFVD